MAVIGARPALPWYLGWRAPGRPGSRARAASRSRAARSRAAARVQLRRDVRPLLMLIVLGAGLALFYLSQSTHVAAIGYEIESLQGALAEERRTQQQLISAIGNARSPASIVERAQRELGLVRLEEGAVQFVPGAPTPPPWRPIDD